MPHRLVANEAQSFQGSNILGKGFVLRPEQAQDLIAKDPRNRHVLFPFLSAEDLNSQPHCHASRWVINFHDWPLDKAAEYSEAFAIVEREVKPARATNNRKVYRDYWWQYGEKRPALLAAIAGLDKVIVVALHTKLLMPARVSSDQVFSHGLCVITSPSKAQLATLSSTMHLGWTLQRGSTLETRIRYTPSDVYETFPRPNETTRLHSAGESLERARQRVMASDAGRGLTDSYNLVHSESHTSTEVDALRQAHIEVDKATAEAYGWTDLDLKHGFYAAPQGQRFTIAPDVQTEILDRLLELNHARYKEEVEKGLHTPEAKRRRAAARKAKAKAWAAARNSSAAQEGFDDGALFADPDALF
jgi:hypothetical protein